MVVNQEKMRALYGGNDYTDKEVLELIKRRVEWLEAHNKNYNKTQWYYIMDIADMLDAFEW